MDIVNIFVKSIKILEDDTVVVNLDFKKLHYYGYNIIYNIKSEKYNVHYSYEPLDKNSALVLDGYIPYKILEKILDKPIDDVDITSFRKPKIRNIRRY